MDANHQKVDSELDKAKEVSARHSVPLLENHGVLGIGVGKTEGNLCIRLYVKKENFEGKDNLPHELEGIPVIVEEFEGDWVLNSDGI